MLSNRSDDGLMIGRCIDGTDAVGASGNAIGNISSQNASLSSCVQALKEVSTKETIHEKEITLKKTNSLGLVGVVWSNAVNFSMTA